MAAASQGLRRLVAVTVVALDEARHEPGTSFSVTAGLADELIALGAAAPDDDAAEDAAPDDDAAEDAAPDDDAAEDAAPDDDAAEEPRSLADVPGIGPATARALAAAGVADLAALAALDDEALAEAATAAKKGTDTVSAWRDRAREMTAG